MSRNPEGPGLLGWGPTGELGLEGLPHLGGLLGLAVGVEGVDGAVEGERADLVVVREEVGGAEETRRGALEVLPLDGDVTERDEEAGPHGTLGVEGESGVGGLAGALPVLEADEDVGLVEEGVGPPEGVVLALEDEPDGIEGALEVPDLDAGLGEVAPDDEVGVLRIVRGGGEGEEIVGAGEVALLEELEAEPGEEVLGQGLLGEFLTEADDLGLEALGVLERVGREDEAGGGVVPVERGREAAGPLQRGDALLPLPELEVPPADPVVGVGFDVLAGACRSP